MAFGNPRRLDAWTRFPESQDSAAAAAGQRLCGRLNYCRRRFVGDRAREAGRRGCKMPIADAALDRLSCEPESSLSASLPKASQHRFLRRARPCLKDGHQRVRRHRAHLPRVIVCRPWLCPARRPRKFHQIIVTASRGYSWRPGRTRESYSEGFGRLRNRSDVLYKIRFRPTFSKIQLYQSLRSRSI